MIDEEKKEEILNAIRKKGIAIDAKDPLFALLIASEFALVDYLNKVDLLFSQHLQSMESATVRYQTEAKELAEVKISKAVNDAFNRLDKYKEEIDEAMKYAHRQKDISSTDSDRSNGIPTIFWLIPIFSAAIGYAAALFII